MALRPEQFRNKSGEKGKGPEQVGTKPEQIGNISEQLGTFWGAIGMKNPETGVKSGLAKVFGA
jgi:hypothetical protein